ncbi:MAG: hypothetical protein E7Z90_03355 [Cyanobacteria bacterium SIG29]|nr:hypothetical protein [Cyanobacteria bacterium SIG29]
MPFSDYNLMNNKEAILQRMKGVQAERKAFGYSVLAGESKDTYAKTPVEANNVQNKNSSDDGKISFKEKVVNFGKGLIAPIKNIFASPKNMAITAVAVAASAALIAVTGGAAAPVMVAAGLIGGGIQIGKGIYKQAKATTDDQAKQAWQQMGTGTFAVGASVAGAKSALKANGVNVEGMSALKASAKCVTSAPKNIANSFSSIGTKVSGWFPALKKKAVKPTVEPEAKPVVKSEAKPTVEPEVQPVVEQTVNPEVKPAPKPAVEAEAKPAVKSETQPAVQPEVKPETASVVEPEAQPIAPPKRKIETKPGAKKKIKSIKKSKPKSEAKPTVEAEAQPAVKPKAKSETTTVVESETQPVVEQTVNPEVKPAVKPTVEPEVQPVVEQTVNPEVKPAPKPAVEPEVKPEGRLKTSASKKKQIITPDGKIINIDDTTATPFWRTSPSTVKPVGVETNTTISRDVNPSMVSRFKNFMNIYGLFKQN